MPSFPKGGIFFFRKNPHPEIPADILLSFTVFFFVKGFPEKPNMAYKCDSLPS